MNRLCRCGHTPGDHQHYRRGGECALCGCLRYRPRWFPWRRAAHTPAPADTRVPGHNPVPGAPASAAPVPPWGPAPAPVPAREAVNPRTAPAPGPLPGRDDPLECVVYHYFSGRREYYGPDGFPVAVMHPAPDRPDAIDLWYRAVCAEEEL